MTGSRPSMDAATRLLLPSKQPSRCSILWQTKSLTYNKSLDHHEGKSRLCRDGWTLTSAS
jgi:hypothetical protein